jgi:protein-disulfide isomerase
MFCIISFVVLSILGIFSASNRELAKEALDCVFRRVTLRPCNTGFDEKMKARILGVVIVRSEGAARFLNKYFEVLAWVFFILLLGSSLWTLNGLYLFYTTGSCNGVNEESFCVFDPKGENNAVSSINPGCAVTPTTKKDLTLKDVNLDLLPVLNKDAKDKIVFIGCYKCENSRKAYPTIRELVKNNNVSLIFGDYPVKEKSDYLSKVGYCIYKEDQDKFWQFNDALFSADLDSVENPDFVNNTLTKLGVSTDKVSMCLFNPNTETAVKAQMTEMEKTKFYGTPTIFIKGAPFVGPKPYRVYAIALKGLWYW